MCMRFPHNDLEKIACHYSGYVFNSRNASPCTGSNSTAKNGARTEQGCFVSFRPALSKSLFQKGVSNVERV